MECPLCKSKDSAHYSTCGVKEIYHECSVCRLIFLERCFLLGREAEFERYKQHNNSLDDVRYRRFLEKLTKPLIQRLGPGAVGLDFGCGPVEAMRGLFADVKIEVKSYDPYFFPDRSVLAGLYDFLILSEVVEHFYDLRAEFDFLKTLVRSGAWVGISTEIIQPTQDFQSWYYRKDPTHVNFFREATLLWLGDYLGWKLELRSGRVTLFRAS